MELRTRLKEISDPVPSFNDMVVKASANALREHPRVNGAYRDGKFELYDNVNVGVAVAAMDALVVPTIFDADKKSLGQIARDARAVIGKVKGQDRHAAGALECTFTVSNLGMFGIEQFTAIINPPQAAILTVGKLEEAAGGGRQGQNRGCATRWCSRSCATTASSTAPTAPSSWRASRTCSNSPSRSRCRPRGRSPVRLTRRSNLRQRGSIAFPAEG